MGFSCITRFAERKSMTNFVKSFTILLIKNKEVL